MAIGPIRVAPVGVKPADVGRVSGFDAEASDGGGREGQGDVVLFGAQRRLARVHDRHGDALGRDGRRGEGQAEEDSCGKQSFHDAHDSMCFIGLKRKVRASGGPRRAECAPAERRGAAS